MFLVSSIPAVAEDCKTKSHNSVWVPFIDRVPNDRPVHKCNKFGVDCYCTNVIVYMQSNTQTDVMGE